MIMMRSFDVQSRNWEGNLRDPASVLGKTCIGERGGLGGWSADQGADLGMMREGDAKGKGDRWCVKM